MSVNSFKSTLVGLWNATAHGAWAMLAIAGISAAVVGVVIFALEQYLGFGTDSLNRPEWTLGLYAAQYSIGLFVLLLVPVVLQKKNKQQLRELFGVLRGPVPKDLLFAVLAAAPYFAISISIQALLAALITGFNVEQVQDVGFSDMNGVAQLIFAFIALVVLAPIAEELIFRGYLFGSARQKLGFWPAAIVTSIVFGIAHGQWNVGIDTFVLSMMLCFLRERTGSVWASIGLHALKNGLAFTLLFIFPL